MWSNLYGPGVSMDQVSAWTKCQYLFSVDASGHGPGGDDVVHDPLTETLWDLVEFEEVSNAI